MNNLTSKQLLKAANIKDQIEALESELASILGSGSEPASNSKAPKTAKKKGMSAAGRARIAAAQKARWAKVNAAKGGSKTAKLAKVVKPGKKSGKMSAKAKAAISAAAKARWAKAKAAGKNTL